MDFNAAIDAARAENAHGLEVRRGKKYTTVAVRVELARRHFGNIGIDTAIIEYGRDNGMPIVVRATVTDEAGRVLATGHAEEIRGQGNVNRTSALENAETSAIGRALAALGLNGGEFASADEMSSAITHDAPPFDAQGAAKRIKDGFARAESVDDLRSRWAAEKATLAQIKRTDAALHADVEAAGKARANELQEVAA